MAEKDAVASEEAEEVPEDDYVDNTSENKPMILRNDTEVDKEVSEILHSEDNEVYYICGKDFRRGVMHSTENPSG